MSTLSPSPTPSTTDRPLSGRVAVVTGASSGIGAATARALAADGAQVALLARRRDRLDALAAELGSDAIALPADVEQSVSLAAAAEAVSARFGRADLVVANAGIMQPAAIEAMAEADWRRQLEVNVSGVLATVQAFLPGLLASAEEDGTADIVTTSSIAARQRFPGYTVYGATKAAVTALAEGLRTDLSPRGVRVTNIEPGLVTTELQAKVEDPESHAFLETWLAETPPIDARHVGELIAYLTSRPKDVNVPQLTILPTHQV
jgi:NADP-dependent 3-hydroxy acid dehydrogenase YdfG